MNWASWTTSGVYAGTGGVRTEEAGILSGDLTVHTTWSDGQASVAVQYSGSSDWFTLTGSPAGFEEAAPERGRSRPRRRGSDGPAGRRGTGIASVRTSAAP
ncbi:hypothetical protein SCALM49S_09637 [Streptomyces californicus]